MKKGYIIAMVGLFIIACLLGYSYYTSKKPAPAATDYNRTVNSDKGMEKKNMAAPAYPSTKQKQAEGTDVRVSNNPSTREEPAKAKPTTPAENRVPLTISEQIETAINNKESCWLLFRSTTCISCVEMQKLFDQLEPDYKGKVRFIAIDVNDRDNIDVIKTWQIRYIPTTFILDSKGQISYQNLGVIPVEDLKAELNKVVK